MNDDFREALLVLACVGAGLLGWGLSTQAMMSWFDFSWWTALIGGLGVAPLAAGFVGFSIDFIVKKKRDSW